MIFWVKVDFAFLKELEIRIFIIFTLFKFLNWNIVDLEIYSIANLENSVVATGLEKVIFHFNPKER